MSKRKSEENIDIMRTSGGTTEDLSAVPGTKSKLLDSRGANAASVLTDSARSIRNEQTSKHHGDGDESDRDDENEESEEREDETVYEKSNYEYTGDCTSFAPPAVGMTSLTLEAFVQQANRTQSKVVSALRSLKRTKCVLEESKENEEENRAQRPRVTEKDSLLQNIAREKTAQLAALMRRLESMETEMAALKVTNESLRDEANQNQERYQRTLDALSIAQRNAAQAREDANAAEMTANELSRTLETLRSVVTDIQETCRHLKASHEQIQEKSASLQEGTWQGEVRIACCEKEYALLQAKYDKLEQARALWKGEKSQLEFILEEKDRTIGSHQRQLQERRTMDEARARRVQHMEAEWRQAQTLMAEASAAQSASTETLSQLQSDLRDLKQKNKDMHEKIRSTQEKAYQEQQRLQEVLDKAQQEAQQLGIQLESSQKENERLLIEKSNLEEAVVKMKNHVSDKESTTSSTSTLGQILTVSPENDKAGSFPFDTSTTSGSDDAITNRSFDEKIPRLSNVPPDDCVFCGKPAFILIKRCQCGSCDQRAHASCIERLGGHKHSGSALSTTRTPIILCKPTMSSDGMSTPTSTK